MQAWTSLGRCAALVVVAVVSAAVSSPALGQTARIWQNATSPWTTASNWGGDAPDTNSEQAVLPASSPHVNPQLNASLTIDSLVIDNSLDDYNITRDGGSRVLTITPGSSTRGVSVNSGVSSMGTLSAGMRFSLGANQTWDIEGDLTVFGANATNVWTGSGRLIKTGAGTLTFNNQNSLGQVGAGPYGGTMNSVTVMEGKFTGVSGQINLNGTGTGTNAPVVLYGNTELTFSMALQNDGSDQVVKFAGTSGTAILGNVTKTTTSGIASTRTVTFDIDNGTSDIDLHLLGAIGQFAGAAGGNPGIPTVNVVKTGAGTLRLNSGGSYYSGTTTLARGTLLLGANATGVSGSNVLGNANSNVQLGSALTAPTDNLAMLVDGGDFTIARALVINSFNNSGTTTLGVNTAHNAVFSGNISLNNHNLNVHAAAGGTATFSSPIVATAGVPSLTKTGDGTVILEGNNLYGGGTTVGAGTLLVNNTAGSGTGVGAVTVQSGATLGGSGTIGGSVNVLDGATLAPGQSAGVLTVGGNVVFGDDATFAVEIGGLNPGLNGHDQLAVTGTVTLGGTLDITITEQILPNFSDEIVLISASSVNGQFSNYDNGDFIALINGHAQLFYTGNQVLLTNFTVPEPSSLVLLGLGAVVMLRARRRSRVAVQG